ncbi:TRAP transporter small permease subunit [Sneathiella sp.]|jgi:TRAP-type C4-dicarboxylate transport system permease small subunit|uniref:TRAP transporter small permease subunit n=1 Tax=Sneathiella sp. TaxID=1964365 RepID=UPI0039E55DA0
MTQFITLINSLSRLFGIFAAILVGAAIIVVCQMVIMRYFLNASTVWQTEFVTYSIVAATFVGSPYVLFVKGHVNVDLLPHYLPSGPRKAMALIASLLAMTFCVVLAWQSYELLKEAFEGGWVTDTVWELPLWIAYLPMFCGMFLLCVQYISEILVTAFDLEIERRAN